MKFLNTVRYCLLLGLTDMALASEKSSVLMLDTRNLKPEKEYWGQGKDYLVSLAKDNNRAPLPSQFTMCFSYFALSTGGENWYYKIMREDPYRMSADAKRALIRRRGKILDIREVSKKGSQEPSKNTH